jgi:thiol-disulfide isomerase/thioredoxin
MKEIKYVGASFCCQCKTFRPKVEEFCKEKNIKFTYVDAEEEAEFVEELGIKNIPLVLLYEGEKLIKRVGIGNWAEIEDFIKNDR